MNPSSSDWIKKFLSLEKQQATHRDWSHFYEVLKGTGFLYGVSMDLISEIKSTTIKLNLDEMTKVNLFHSLYYSYKQIHPKDSKEKAISSILEFYKHLDRGKKGWFKKLFNESNESKMLEEIIAKRLHESNTFLKINAVSLLTYALLFIDVLSFHEYLKNGTKPKEYIKKTERLIILSCFLALQSKRKKNKYDTLLIELFESSTQYLVSDAKAISLDAFKNVSLTLIEKQYLLDVSSLAVWEDSILDASEILFLENLAISLDLPLSMAAESISSLQKFSEKNATKVTLFEYSNPVKQFYKQSTNTVKRLIIRNQARLIQELAESGELVKLLSYSTVRDLDATEKKKVKEQLLDVCKSIPSLTIFLLPGGTILLPLLIKFIPKLLPSAFDDNRVDEKN
ncbi:MAG: LETM1-related biofilm-associated protein [Patiriisocius sp.]|uniref:LETM1-related biofilm-associated protein n=1 Tax=Patiriisocius sp. TaxID=2822396 RepID=UPI003EF660FF